MDGGEQMEHLIAVALVLLAGTAGLRLLPARGRADTSGSAEHPDQGGA